MSNLSPADIKYLDNALRLETGFIVRFTKESFADFFNILISTFMMKNILLMDLQ